MIWTKVFGRTSILVGWWLGMVWTRWSTVFSKHPFRPVAFFYSSFSSKSSWWKISSAARNWINSGSHAAATTFAFSSVFILLTWYSVGPNFLIRTWSRKLHGMQFKYSWDYLPPLSPALLYTHSFTPLSCPTVWLSICPGCLFLIFMSMYLSGCLSVLDVFFSS